jgi:hypothetical protein
MKLVLSVVIVGLLACGASAANAQGTCPFLEFCSAQRGHCHSNCWALTDVIPWSQRPTFVQRCTNGCDGQYSRCVTRQRHNCLQWR